MPAFPSFSHSIICISDKICSSSHMSLLVKLILDIHPSENELLASLFFYLKVPIGILHIYNSHTHFHVLQAFWWYCSPAHSIQ